MYYSTYSWPEREELDAMTNKQAHEFFEAFLAVKARRVEMLFRLVLDETGIVLNYSRKSLSLLHPWCEKQARIRMYTPEQMKAVYADPMLRIAAESEPMFVLTKKADSIGADLGIYFCECVHKKFPDLEWRQRTQRVHGYRWPVLYGLPGSHGLEPLSIGTAYLYRLAEIRKGIEVPRPPKGLHLLFDRILQGMPV